MGKTRYVRAIQFINRLKSQKKLKFLDKEFIVEIQKYLGADSKRTVQPYIKLMLETNLIKEEGEYVELI